jgi:hypothetical protein
MAGVPLRGKLGFIEDLHSSNAALGDQFISSPANKMFPEALGLAGMDWGLLEQTRRIQVDKLILG